MAALWRGIVIARNTPINLAENSGESFLCHPARVGRLTQSGAYVPTQEERLAPTAEESASRYPSSMPNENYQSASEMIRSLDKIRVPYEQLEERGPFRLLRFSPPYWDGYEFWLVNEKGFMWEPGESLASLHGYLEGNEAKEYMESAA